MATQWGSGVLPPPPGIEPNLVDPSGQFHGNVALHSVLLTVATLSIGVRFYTRTFITRSKLGIDDFCCLIAYLCAVAFSSLMIVAFKWGIGRHMWDEPMMWLPVALKYFTFAQYCYLVCSGVVKLSFLFFYRRVFSAQTKSKYYIDFGIAFVFCANTALLFATIFSCTPIARAWNPILRGHCIHPRILPWLSGVLNSVTDIYVLVLPASLLWGLHLELERKIKLLAVFGLGIFACTASLVRLGMTSVLYKSLDSTWNISTIAIWAVLEIDVAIICASLTFLPAFLEHHWPQSFSNSIAHLWSYTGSSRKKSKSGGSSGQGSRNTIGSGGQKRAVGKKEWPSDEFITLNDGELTWVNSDMLEKDSNSLKYPVGAAVKQYGADDVEQGSTPGRNTPMQERDVLQS
ncbi:hypothetical protein GQ43DRAFT_411195 [Delitschia confertaspora ATCC 74209]|uniref:Rhodopsin domain-containing protein n=1 Tax=Delitschia confertaspora ATCC 74209 TaxID=1513339 RepID=A0A9P4JQE3_9PLEO|nr:hypothetical protein GQ43DRAFT_411195 [Delitschia confertaspora ATCC 74209]